jgi:Domain of unknown function (DUF5655)
MGVDTEKPLWRCPTCNQEFVTPNMPHSCQVRSIDEYFAGTDPALRELFDHLVAAVRENGPVTVNVTKSRVAFQARGRFAGIDRPRRDHLVASFILTRPAVSDRLIRVEYIPPYYYAHRLRLRHRDDIDAELEAWLSEAYRIGEQRHVTQPDWPNVRRPPDWVRVPREVAEAIARGDDPSTVR